MNLRCVFCYYDETIIEEPHEAMFVINGMSVCESAELHMEAAELPWPESLAWLRRQTKQTPNTNTLPE